MIKMTQTLQMTSLTYQTPIESLAEILLNLTIPPARVDYSNRIEIKLCSRIYYSLLDINNDLASIS